MQQHRLVHFVSAILFCCIHKSSIDLKSLLQMQGARWDSPLQVVRRDREEGAREGLHHVLQGPLQSTKLPHPLHTHPVITCTPAIRHITRFAVWFITAKAAFHTRQALEPPYTPCKEAWMPGWIQKREGGLPDRHRRAPAAARRGSGVPKFGLRPG